MISTAATATCKQARTNCSTLLFSSTSSRLRTRIRRTTDLLLSCHYFIPSRTYTALRTNVAAPIGHNSSHFYRQHSSHFQLSPFPMPQTRSHSTKQPAQAPVGATTVHKEPAHDHAHEHNHEHDHDHDEHSHSHSLFGHSHSHGPEAHTHDAEQIIAALKGSGTFVGIAYPLYAQLPSTGDRGSYITLVGLFSNIALTGAKGLAGWYLHSASLLADAGHSLSGASRVMYPSLSVVKLT